jgi:homoserine dehydrogenase
MEDGKLNAFVQPRLFESGEPEAAVSANYNLITLVGSASGRMSFYGQGAGRYPTAYNVMQDCADVLRGKGYYSPYGGKVSAVNDKLLSYYVRGEVDAWLEENKQDTWGEATITKPVAVSDMHAWLKAHPNSFIAAMPAK